MQFYGQSVILGMEVIVPMKVLLTRLPVPVGCVALGLIGLAVLLSGYSTLFLWIFGLCSILLQLLLVLKCCLPGQLRTACGDCVTLSTLAGYSMALMLTSVQLKTFLPYAAAFVLWCCGLLLHLIIIVLFSRKLLRERPSAFAAICRYCSRFHFRVGIRSECNRPDSADSRRAGCADSGSSDPPGGTQEQ